MKKKSKSVNILQAGHWPESRHCPACKGVRAFFSHTEEEECFGEEEQESDILLADHWPEACHCPAYQASHLATFVVHTEEEECFGEEEQESEILQAGDWPEARYCPDCIAVTRCFWRQWRTAKGGRGTVCVGVNTLTANGMQDQAETMCSAISF